MYWYRDIYGPKVSPKNIGDKVSKTILDTSTLTSLPTNCSIKALKETQTQPVFYADPLGL